MKRRTLFASLCTLAVVCAAEAQQTAAVLKIGVITLGVAATSPYLEAFRQGLREHG